MPSSKPIQILVVDDHFMVRMGLSASLSVEPDMDVVAEAANGEAALTSYRRSIIPLLVIMDVRLPGSSGGGYCRDRAGISGECACTDALDSLRRRGSFRALQRGARGYILKSAMRDDVACDSRSIRRQTLSGHHGGSVAGCAGCRTVRSQSANSKFFAWLQKVWETRKLRPPLNIAEVTVKLHVSHVLEKLGVIRTEASTVALDVELFRSNSRMGVSYTKV